MALRSIDMVMTARVVGHAFTWGYPHGTASEVFVIPTYELTVGGTNRAGRRVDEKFEVFRFGVQRKATGPARVVGLAERQRHVIKAWIPTYQVHSADSKENGAWQVIRNWLIHDGPDNPKSRAPLFASIGCIEVCGGPEGFVKFNDLLIDLSGPTAPSRDMQLAEIGASRNMAITFLPASRPPLRLG